MLDFTCTWVRGTLPSEKVTKCHVFVRGLVAHRSKAPLKIKYGCVAQLVAQLTLNQLVVGSNPTTPTIIIERVSTLFCFVKIQQIL